MSLISKNLQFTNGLIKATTRLSFSSTTLPFSFEKRVSDIGGSAFEKKCYAQVHTSENRVEETIDLRQEVLKCLENRNTNYRQYISELKFDQSVRALIIKSDVPDAFCAGADLKERQTYTIDDFTNSGIHPRYVLEDIAKLPFPTIAAMQGYAVGGGLELALACDIRVAKHDAKMGLVETRIAMTPGGGGTQRLARIVGLSLAKELIFTSRVITGKEAKEMRLVSHATEDDPYNKSLKIAQEILKNGPMSVRMAKLAIDYGSQMDMASGLILEQQVQARLIPTEDRVEGLKSFAEKRPPVYKNK